MFLLKAKDGLVGIDPTSLWALVTLWGNDWMIVHDRSSVSKPLGRS